MKKFLTILLLLSSTAAFAALNKWVDGEGKVHYSDQPPPPNLKSETLRTRPAPAAEAPPSAAAPSATPSDAEREAELKRKQQAEKEAADRDALEQANREIERTNCENARQSLRSLEAGGRLAEYDASGEMRYVEDDERGQRIAKEQAAISRWCK